MNYFLVGRPNVGKSSIFNIFSHFNRNIIHKNEGTTRDWHKEIIKNTSSYIFDTPGLNIDKKKNNLKILSFFNKNLITDIDIFLYVIDYKSRYNSVIASRVYGQHLHQECNACISIKVHARLKEGFRKEN